MSDAPTKCTGDACDISATLRQTVSNMDELARDKLRHWLKGMEPMDYDAPGSRVRESGV